MDAAMTQLEEAEAREHTLAARAARAFAGFRAGDESRMVELVDLVSPILWHTARAQHLDTELAQDAVQTAWLRLVGSASSIKDPQAVLGWLIVTTKREAWRLGRLSSRELPADTTDQTAAELIGRHPSADATGSTAAGSPAAEPSPELYAELGEEQRLLWGHLSRLSERCQALLRVVAFADRPDYAQVAAALGMPVGSIGPTRGRCLAKLRAALDADPQWDVTGRSS